MYIIQIEPLEGTNVHPVESQSHRTSCWLDGYVEVPEPLLEKAISTYVSCNLVMQDGVLVDIEPLELPQEENREPSPEEDTQAMMVEHEYRLTLLELGVSE